MISFLTDLNNRYEHRRRNPTKFDLPPHAYTALTTSKLIRPK